MSIAILTQDSPQITHAQQLITLMCIGCGKERPFRLVGVKVGRFIHECAICGEQHSTHVAAGSLRKQPPSLFDKLHRIIMRDFTRLAVVNTSDERFFKIFYTIDGDDYEVQYMDYRPVEIRHRFKTMTQGHTFYPWLNGVAK